MIRFYGLRFLRDYIGHIILIGLPIVMIIAMVFINQGIADPSERNDVILYISLVYIIMFQGFGTAYAFEGIEHDFFKPFRARLMIAPVSQMRFIYMNLIGSIITSLCQTFIILATIWLIYNIQIPMFGFVVMVLMIASITLHFLGTYLILVFKKASVVQTIMTGFIIVSMFAGGYFIPFKSSRLTDFLNEYGSPIAWTHTSVYGFMNQNYNEAFMGIGLLILLTIICALLMKKALKKVL